MRSTPYNMAKRKDGNLEWRPKTNPVCPDGLRRLALEPEDPEREYGGYKEMNLWLDDIRTPPADRPWIWVRTVDECIAKIKRKRPQRLSLDNDLGCGQKEGREVLDWLEKRVVELGAAQVPDEIFVHSANPVAAARMKVVAERIRRFAASGAMDCRPVPGTKRRGAR